MNIIFNSIVIIAFVPHYIDLKRIFFLRACSILFDQRNKFPFNTSFMIRLISLLHNIIFVSSILLLFVWLFIASFSSHWNASFFWGECKIPQPTDANTKTTSWQWAEVCLRRRWQLLFHLVICVSCFFSSFFLLKSWRWNEVKRCKLQV